MSQLEELKPKVKQRVIDLVRSVGIDVSDWANFKGGKELAASNPKYCYEWSFVAGPIVVVNLWHANLRESDGLVSIEFNLRENIRRYSKAGGKEVWKAQARRLDLAIQEAARHNLTIRAIINDGKMRDPDDMAAKASRVKHRLLDRLPWVVKSYDAETGKCALARGALPGPFVDQFSVSPGLEPSVERRDISVSVAIRNPAHRSRALERAEGKCEYCAEPGFKMKNGKIFLETHHVIPLGEGGPDAEHNVVALCPNHHREAHHGAQAPDIRRKLLSQIQLLKCLEPKTPLTTEL
jgi:5-methylcytosine-specific restriction protein A